MGFDIAEAIIKSAAVGGITYLWANFTLKAIKISRQIVFSQKETEIKHLFRCESCNNHFPEYKGFDRWCLGQMIFVCYECVGKKSCVKIVKNVFSMTEKNWD